MEFRKYQHIERFGTDEVDGIEIGTTYVFPKIDEILYSSLLGNLPFRSIDTALVTAFSESAASESGFLDFDPILPRCPDRQNNYDNNHNWLLHSLLPLSYAQSHE